MVDFKDKSTTSNNVSLDNFHLVFGGETCVEQNVGTREKLADFKVEARCRRLEK